MTLGDGIRRNIATISEEERILFVNAIRKLDDSTSAFIYPNNAGHEGADANGNITYWDMQEQIHKDAHAHGVDVHVGPAFVPWHRVIVNRLEILLRLVEPRLSLHYWDWTTDPRPGNGDPRSILGPHGFMGNDNGYAGAPFADFESTEKTDTADGGDGIHDHIWRDVAGGNPPPSPPAIDSDDTILSNPDFTSFNTALQNAHNSAHPYIGGTLSDAHFSFHDPMVFLLHSNMDRLWAMWQRQRGKPERLNPATAYGNILADEGLPSNYFEEWVAPWSGISNPALPGGGTPVTDLNPWRSDPAQQAHVDYRDLSIILPASYDTAPHSSYIVANQDTFSTSEAAISLAFTKAFYVVYEGFQPREVGAPGASLPAFTFLIGGTPVASMKASSNPQVFMEDPSGAPDMPQRISLLYDVVFTDISAFPTAIGAEAIISMQVSLDYTVGGTSVQARDQTSVQLLLVNQPSPYMVDIDPAIPPPGPTNPYWLSTDMRVFQVKQNDPPLAPGLPQQQTDPFEFITSLVNAFNGLPNDNNHPFLTLLSQDENASQLELSPTVGGTPVFNYAIAKIRYRGNVPASNVSVFFRAFNTMVSALDYDHTSGLTGNYRRSGNTLGSVPLLGIQSNEIACIPFFAKARIDTKTQPMTSQLDDPINTQISFAGNGQEEVIYCGVWLDINDINNARFPQDPTSDPGGVNGPYQNQLFTIQQLVTGLHYCLVAEIFFWPPGTTVDPIPVNSTPASSDRLAQRNISLDPAGNPGWPSTHTVQQTFLVKPSIKRGIHVGADELMIQWGNVPRATQATLFFPEIKADEILSLSMLRQHPVTLAKVDDNTISVKVADVTFIPVPVRLSGNLAGLMTLTLPQGIRVGQVFKISVQQYSGNIIREERSRRMLGAFQFNIPVNTDPQILPKAIRNLSILRYIQQTIPTTNRWYPIFVRWLNGLAAKVAGLGGDPTQILPSPTGGDVPPGAGEPGEERIEFRGKVDGLIYDRFGDFEGFLLDTEDGKRRFRSRQHQVEELIHAAWIERIPTIVSVERHELRHPMSITLHGSPPRNRRWYEEK